MVYSEYLADQDGYFAIEVESRPVQTLVNRSAAELVARRITMGTNQKRVPGTLGAADNVVAKGDFYPETTGSTTSILLEASKFGQAFPLADEDLADEAGYINAVNQFGTDWASKHAVKLDNAVFATTGGVGVADTETPFTSVYYAVRHNNSAAGYTADDNYASTTKALLAAVSTNATTGGHNILSNFLGLAEGRSVYSEADTVIVAHTAFKPLFRTIVNSQGDPMFSSGVTSVSGFVNGSVSRSADALFNIPIVWSAGLRLSAVSDDAPSGHPIMIAANRENLLLGVRSGPESKEERIPGKDVVELMFRSRRAFAIANPYAAAVLELTA